MRCLLAIRAIAVSEKAEECGSKKKIDVFDLHHEKYQHFRDECRKRMLAGKGEKNQAGLLSVNVRLTDSLKK